MAKLTLNVEPDVIQAAKQYAQAHHVSLSKLVTQFLRELPQTSHDFLTQLHETLLEEGFQESSADTQALRRAHVKRKYQ
jgi:chemotaxis regulatin CheY-phosphate phosphatase CheZ